MIDVISSTLSQSDVGVKVASCQFLENLSLKRVVDVQRCEDNIIAVVKADDIVSCLACGLLAKLATDEVTKYIILTKLSFSNVGLH